MKRADGVKVKNPNIDTKFFPYIAVKKLVQVCGKCFPEQGQGVYCNGTKSCFRGKCSKCSFFGHGGSTCLQTHNVIGEKIVATA